MQHACGWLLCHAYVRGAVRQRCLHGGRGDVPSDSIAVRRRGCPAQKHRFEDFMVPIAGQEVTRCSRAGIARGRSRHGLLDVWPLCSAAGAEWSVTEVARLDFWREERKRLAAGRVCLAAKTGLRAQVYRGAVQWSRNGVEIWRSAATVRVRSVFSVSWSEDWGLTITDQLSVRRNAFKPTIHPGRKSKCVCRGTWSGPSLSFIIVKRKGKVPIRRRDDDCTYFNHLAHRLFSLHQTLGTKKAARVPAGGLFLALFADLTISILVRNKHISRYADR